jgi:hypothetical protein
VIGGLAYLFDYVLAANGRISPRLVMQILIMRRNVMKKTLIIALMFGIGMVFVPAAEANAAATAAITAEQYWESQPRRGRWDRRDNRRDRRYNDRRWNRGRPYSYVTTRIVRRWFRTYRETIRVTHLPNGRTHTQVIRRVRIR